MKPPIPSNAIELRKHLHAHPEVSGMEADTASTLLDYLGEHPSRQVVSGVGGYGIMLIYDSQNPGPVILLRGDIDALPIQEEPLGINYASKYKGIAHLCGHDGHTAILAEVARILDTEGIGRGKVILLFQPSEENGEGAHAVLNDEKFNVKPDYVFALHNIPGREIGSVISRKHTFAYSSTGIVIHFAGRTSHAAEPEKGLSPEAAVIEFLQKLNELREDLTKESILTTTHVRIGERAFGISPGASEVCLTLRSDTTDRVNEIFLQISDLTESIGLKHGLKYSINKTEFFPATMNDPAAEDIIQKAAMNCGMNVIDLKEPYRWSEDFGWFTEKFSGALFGLGSGIEQVPLHHPSYDFPDELISEGAKIFHEIIKVCLEHQS